MIFLFLGNLKPLATLLTKFIMRRLSWGRRPLAITYTENASSASQQVVNSCGKKVSVFVRRFGETFRSIKKEMLRMMSIGRFAHIFELSLACQQRLLLLLGFIALIGCGPGADDPAAVDRLKAAGMLPMKQNDQVYQIKGLMKPLTEETAADIASLAGLKLVDFSASELTDELFSKAASKLNPVSVVLSETAISDTGLQAMSGYRRIEAVFIRNTSITDAGLQTIGGLTSLMELDLTGTKITSAGLTHLSGLKNLKRLILDKTAVDDSGLDSLKSLSKLAVLEVRETGVTNEGASALGAAIDGLSIDR